MVARVASFEGVNVEVAERTMDQAESIIRPLMEALDGYQGHLELLASDGKVLSIALFDSEENARAAEPTFDEEMPRQLGDVFKDWEGRRVSVERYRVLSESRSLGISRRGEPCAGPRSLRPDAAVVLAADARDDGIGDGWIGRRLGAAERVQPGDRRSQRSQHGAAAAAHQQVAQDASACP